MMELRKTVSTVQTSYEQQAHRRIALQRQLAGILQHLQDKSRDRFLIEDTIIVTLQTEQMVKDSRIDIPEKPVFPENQPQGRTTSAEEAYQVYTEQLDLLTQEQAFRSAMEETERTMADIYQRGLERIVEVVEEFCTENPLQSHVLEMAA